ncbi:hypothetical protein BZA70DRAFT_286323 [Myxozyma melibiosi]|uniref:Zn(2)-C6 fungal-type domain-containing protein n=1 Tax=Myxozyma melibiosi TaxID=54550 RepID=A0ABR1EXK4_9ASCO
MGSAEGPGATDDEPSPASAPAPRRRVRTGCLTCRSRHRKCDEKRPTCDNCAAKKLDCQWSVKGLFQESNSRYISASGHISVVPRVSQFTIVSDGPRGNGPPKKRQRKISESDNGTIEQSSELPLANTGVSSTRAPADSRLTIHEEVSTAERAEIYLLEGVSLATDLSGYARTDQETTRFAQLEPSRQPGDRSDSSASNTSATTDNSTISYNNGSAVPNLERASLRTILNLSENRSSSASDAAQLNKFSMPGLDTGLWRQGSLAAREKYPEQLRAENFEHRISISNIAEIDHSHQIRQPISLPRIHSASCSPDFEGYLGSQSNSTSSGMSEDEEDGAEDDEEEEGEAEFLGDISISYKDLHINLLECIEVALSEATSRSTSTSRSHICPGQIRSRSELSSLDKARLLRNYVDNVADSLDLCNNDHHFAVEIPRMALTNNALLYAIFAISSKQFECVDSNYPPGVTLDIYWDFLQYLAPELPSCSMEVIASCVILCGLELMGSKSNHRRRHVTACASLLAACNITGMTSGFGGAMFWCLARMDIATVMIGEEPTIIRNHGGTITQAMSVNAISALFRSHWLSAKASRACDSYANYSLLLAARVIALISREGRYADSHGPWEQLPNENASVLGYDGEWEELWNGLREWVERRPEYMLPLFAFQEEKDGRDVSPFPTVLYGNGSATTPPMLWHAKQICAIAQTNKNRELEIAGQLMSHQSEHATIFQVLQEIAATTGCAVDSCRDELREIWGV